ncbi:MAG TPA: ABC transporter ATP-binding protein [Candidatus Binatia bacterium]|nr:ABC transporter ATP-binding protein [Candidatus Binatia bacterium]
MPCQSHGGLAQARGTWRSLLNDPAHPDSGEITPVIELDAVSKRFGSVTAVDSASLRIGRGEFFSLLGPSGCGKTTVLRLIGGLEQPDAGRILLDGADVAGTPPHRRNVNTVFQQYALFPHLSVFDNVAFGPRTRRLAAQEVTRKVAAMLELVRLGDLASRRPHQLSGGQRQRVALARALVNEPSAVLLDEPLSALDLQLRREMQVELQRLQRQTGIAFVLVTHDREEAWTLSDRTAVMRGGRIEQIGTPRKLYERPGGAFVAGFIGDASWIGVRVVACRHERAEVVLPGGRRVVTPAAEGLRSDQNALLMVRPEHVRLTATIPAAQGGIGAVAVTVVETAFQGGRTLCRTRDDEGNQIAALIDAGPVPQALARGTRLIATFDAERARALVPGS